MRPAVFDASVVVRPFLPVEGAERALLATRRFAMVAPSLLLVEAANAFWKYVRRGIAPLEDCQAALRHLSGYADLRPDMGLYDDALELAARLEHPVYDCLYLALARREAYPLISADRRLLALADDRLGLEAIALTEFDEN